MTRNELDQVIYERTRELVGVVHLDCILELIAAERKKEREACAELAERMDFHSTLTGFLVSPDQIAAAIRARGQ
jgi:hypothetical protein